METNSVMQHLGTQAIALGLKVLGAIAIWIIGIWLIRFGTSLLKRALTAKRIDTTIIAYIGAGVSVLLKIILIIAIFGYFGVETTSIAALLAGIGLAIGTMWGGLWGTWQQGPSLYFCGLSRSAISSLPVMPWGPSGKSDCWSPLLIRWTMSEPMWETARSFQAISRISPRILTGASISRPS